MPDGTSRGCRNLAAGRTRDEPLAVRRCVLRLLRGPAPSDLDVVGVGAVHDEDGFAGSLGTRRRVVDTQDVDWLSAGIVAQAGDADEVAVAGRSNRDEPTACRNVEDLIDVELYCGHDELVLYRSKAGISLSYAWSSSSFSGLCRCSPPCCCTTWVCSWAMVAASVSSSAKLAGPSRICVPLSSEGV